MADPSRLNVGLQLGVPAEAAIGDVLQVIDVGAGVKGLGFGPGGGGGGPPIDEAAIQALIDATPDRWVVDPHLEPFNARGNARTWLVANKGQTNVPNDTLIIANYNFTIFDVGKKVHTPDSYNAYEGRTILSINADGDAVVDIPFAAAGWFTNFVVTVGTDDTDALQSALDYAQNVMGELGDTTVFQDPAPTHALFGSYVKLRAGHRYLVCNTQARFNGGAGPHAALTVGRRTGLVGAEGGRYASQIVIGTGNFGHGIATPGEDYYVDYVILKSFALMCYGDIGGDQNLDGINFAIKFDGYQNVDAYNLIQDVHIQGAARDGLFMRGRGETVVFNVNIAKSGRFGAYFEHQADYVVIRLNAGGSNKTGIRIENSGAGHWFDCKSYYNGVKGYQVVPQYDTVNGVFGLQSDILGVPRPLETHEANSANWHFMSDNEHNGGVLTHGCESQESFGSAIVMDSGQNLLDAFTIADPGRVGMQGADGARPAIVTGIHFRGVFCHNNVLSGVNMLPNLAAYQAKNWGDATSLIYIEDVAGNGSGPQANKGDIWSTPEPWTGPDGVERTGLNFNGGAAAQGAGTTNGQNTKLQINRVALT